MTDTRNGALSEQVAGADLDPRAKGFMEMLEKDENVPPELLEKLRGAGSDLIRRLFSDEDTDEEKVKQADAYYEGIKSFIDKNEWHASIVDKENRVIAMGFSMKNAAFKVLVRVDAEAESVTINATLPISCLSEYRFLMDRAGSTRLFVMELLGLMRTMGKSPIDLRSLSLVRNSTTRCSTTILTVALLPPISTTRKLSSMLLAHLAGRKRSKSSGS